MNHNALNEDCYCWPVSRGPIVQKIIDQDAASNMEAMLSQRPHYFARTTIFIDPDILAQIITQIHAIEAVIKRPEYVKAVYSRDKMIKPCPEQANTRGIFMGYDFHITPDGPRLIEINSNAGGAFIVDMIEQTVKREDSGFAQRIARMFHEEWEMAERKTPLKTIAIIDENPSEQFHFPDMCLSKSLLERQGLQAIITDPKELRLDGEKLYYENTAIDLIYNRLTDFDLSEPQHSLIRRVYREGLTVITPAPHHHALYADKRNLIMLSHPAQLSKLDASTSQINALSSIPATKAVTPENAQQMWEERRQLFFKPQAGYGSRGAFRGAKLSKKVWSQILEGGYIAQKLIPPPVRAVTVDGEKQTLKFDVRVYSYDGKPLLYAARIYQGQTTNLRTAGGGLTAVIPISTETGCSPLN